ncbi:hypothetical protein PFLUV_G00186670 [Perca fluviatilis]|uniref:Pyrin domain-containing protein n=1 Tax=Perca fluviatilis TaxID=8168 RepID=A0A6A5DUK0_PERFL|nr:uncharacterized protein LOC120543673 isoform X1 [Perca fluviatilis]KAF1378107.1 hypothetical protein PFLUV_G00186670 [Perca fluviatilis]
MSLKLLEAKWKPALSSILEQLTEPEFRKMLFNLVKIPQGVKTGKAREYIPDLIVQYYGTEGSISKIDKIMKNIPRNDAAVQEPLRPFVEKLKKQRQGKKGTMTKLSIDFGSVAKKQKPAADQLKSCQPDQKKTISTLGTKALAGKVVQSSAQCTNKRKRKMDPVNAAKPKKKTETQDSSLKHQASASNNMDRVGAVETEKKTEEQDSSLKPVESIKTSKVPSTAVQTGRIQIMDIKKSNKKKTYLVVEFNGRSQTVFVTTQLLANAFGLEVEDDCESRLRYQMPLTAEATLQGKKVTDIKKMDPVGDVKPDQKKEEQDSSLKHQASASNNMDPVAAVETEKKTEEQYSSQKPVESMKTSKVPSTAVQTGRIQIMDIKKSNKKKTYLVVEFNGRRKTVIVTTQLLANAFGLEVEDDFERRLGYQMPLTAEATLQGKKVTDIKKMDPVANVKPDQKTEEQDSSLKLAAPSKTFKDQSAAVWTGKIQILGIKKSNNTNIHLMVEFNGRKRTFFLTNRLLASAFGLEVDDDFERRVCSQMPLTAEATIQGEKKITDLKKMDSVGDVTMEQKTENKDVSLKPAQSTKTSKAQSAAVQTGRIQIINIKKSNKKKTHLVVEFNGRMRTVFVTTHLLANAFVLKVDDDIERRLHSQMPLTAEVTLQGSKITDIRVNPNLT